MRQFIFAFLLFLISLFTDAGNFKLIINDNNDNYLLSPYFRVFTDTTNTVSLQKILSGKCRECFAPLDAQILNRKPSDFTYWLAADISDLSTAEYHWFLNINYAPIDYISIYIVDESGTTDTLFNGGNNVPGDHFLQNRTAVNCELPMKKNTAYKILFRIKTSSYLILPAKIMGLNGVIKQKSQKIGVIFFLFGILITAFLFNLVLFILLKENVYLLLSILILAMILGAMTQFGVELWTFPVLIDKNQQRLIFFGLIYVLVNTFIIVYQEIKRFRRLLYVFHGITLFLIMYIIMVLFGVVPGYQMSMISPYIALSIMLIYFATSIFTLIKKIPLSEYFFVYVIIVLISSVIWTLMLNNLLPVNILTRFIHLIAFSLIALVFSLGLTRKITELHKEKEKSILLESFNLSLRTEIEERKKTEIALKKSEQELRELNLTKNKFFSIIGHDLMNPFNALLGFSTLLVESLKNKDYRHSNEFAGYIAQSAENIADVLHNLLVWAKSQNQGEQFNPVHAKLIEVVNENLMLLMPNIQNKNLHVQTEIDEQVSARFDVVMISTVIRNLITNAIKFTNPGGTFVIKGDIHEAHLHFTISDNGIGMTDEQLAELFTIKKRFTSLGTGNESGSGLGLLICKEYIERHQGRIWAKSTPGKGSDFHFTIPVLLS